MPFLSQESIDVGCLGGQSLICNSLYIVTEFLVLCNEVGLRVNLYGYCTLAVLSYNVNYDTLSCDSVGFLLSLCKTFLSQELNGFVHIAVVSVRSLFAVHHACAGHFSQFFTIAAVIAHFYIPSVV